MLGLGLAIRGFAFVQIGRRGAVRRWRARADGGACQGDAVRRGVPGPDGEPSSAVGHYGHGAARSGSLIPRGDIPRINWSLTRAQRLWRIAAARATH